MTIRHSSAAGRLKELDTRIAPEGFRCAHRLKELDNEVYSTLAHTPDSFTLTTLGSSSDSLLVDDHCSQIPAGAR